MPAAPLLRTPQEILAAQQSPSDQADPFSHASTLLSSQDQPYGGVNPYGAQQQLPQYQQLAYAPQQPAITFGQTPTGSGAIDRFMASLRGVESSNNYQARNSIGASGAYQFMDPTWGGYGGYKSAYLAPPQVQDARARELMSAYYNKYGDWRLVAVAWLAGPGTADRIMRGDQGAWNVSDGNITAKAYADRVLAGMGGNGIGAAVSANIAGGKAPPPSGAGASWSNLSPLAQSNAQLVLGRFPTLHFTSGWRDPVHNAEVGGVPDSAHLRGMATDMVGPQADMLRAAQFAQSIGGHPLIHDAGSGLHLHITWG